LDKLPEASGEKSKEQVKQLADKRKMIRDNLLICATKLNEVEQEYGMSAEDRRVIANIILKNQIELQRKFEATLRAREKAKAAEAAPTKISPPREAGPPPAVKDIAPPSTAEPSPTAKSESPKQ
jgi:hypothetical protein